MTAEHEAYRSAPFHPHLHIHLPTFFSIPQRTQISIRMSQVAREQQIHDALGHDGFSVLLLTWNTIGNGTSRCGTNSDCPPNFSAQMGYTNFILRYMCSYVQVLICPCTLFRRLLFIPGSKSEPMLALSWKDLVFLVLGGGSECRHGA
jgi:hypothetical protein